MRNAYPPVFFSRDTDAEEWRHPNKPAARVSIMRDGLKASFSPTRRPCSATVLRGSRASSLVKSSKSGYGSDAELRPRRRLAWDVLGRAYGARKMRPR